MPGIVTERLMMRRETPEDYLDAFAWSGDEEGYRYLKSNACKKPEATLAMMDYVIREYGAHTFQAECARENYGSARVMEHLGLTYLRDSGYSKHDGTTFASGVYRLELQESVEKPKEV